MLRRSLKQHEVFHLLAVRNTAKYSPALFAAASDARHDWQIFLELSRRLAAAKERHGLVSRLTHAALRGLGAPGLVALLQRLGPRGSLNPFKRGLATGASAN